jgi:hypothetical protein
LGPVSTILLAHLHHGAINSVTSSFPTPRKCPRKMPVRPVVKRMIRVGELPFRYRPHFRFDVPSLEEIVLCGGSKRERTHEEATEN